LTPSGCHPCTNVYVFIWQDSFGRLHDKGKDVPRATKLLTKLFPNKVMIHMPQVCTVESLSYVDPFDLGSVTRIPNTALVIIVEMSAVMGNCADVAIS